MNKLFKARWLIVGLVILAVLGTLGCPTDPTIFVTGVTLNESTLNLLVGEQETLIATVAPADATNKAVTWASSDDDVATVSQTGEVTAVGVGTATITVTTDDGDFGATADVTVSPVAVTGVTLNKTTLELYIGDSETLIATVAPANATNKAVTWASDDETVATVSQTGEVIAVGVGTAIITVTTDDGDFEDTADVTVEKKPLFKQTVAGSPLENVIDGTSEVISISGNSWGWAATLVADEVYDLDGTQNFTFKIRPNFGATPAGNIDIFISPIDNEGATTDVSIVKGLYFQIGEYGIGAWRITDNPGGAPGSGIQYTDPAAQYIQVTGGGWNYTEDITITISYAAGTWTIQGPSAATFTDAQLPADTFAGGAYFHVGAAPATVFTGSLTIKEINGDVLH